MTEIPKDLIGEAGRVLYVCRPWDGQPKATRMSCSDCGASVAVSPEVLVDRRKQVHAAGRSMAVVCDDCGLQAGLESGVMVAVMPTQEEIRSTK